jgi:hypothetical protein
VSRAAKGRAAIGLRAHSGWAALVAIAGSAAGIEVVGRRRIELADPAIPGSKQPYHEAEGLPPEKARALLDRLEADAQNLARKAFGEVLEELARKGHEPRACGLLTASGRPLPALESVLASHALIHAADGEHFRAALSRAGEHFRLRVLRVREKEVLEKASGALNLASEALRRRVETLGRAVGPPWTQDQKLAALAGWLALERQ